jgi:putative sigma-54 modulation protein
MKVIVKGVHLRVSRALKRHIEQHLVGPISGFYDNSAAELSVHLVDTNGPKGGLDKEVRITVRIPGTKSLHVTETTDNIYKSIVLARERIERLAKRQISRRRTRPPSARVMRSDEMYDLSGLP